VENSSAAEARDTRCSPHAGIVLVPFLATLPADGSYPGFADFYGSINSLSTNTVDLTLETITITNKVFYILNSKISELLGHHESGVMNFGFTKRSDAGVWGEVNARGKGAHLAVVHARSCYGFGKRVF
jgi:hypothetical protein